MVKGTGGGCGSDDSVVVALLRLPRYGAAMETPNSAAQADMLRMDAFILIEFDEMFEQLPRL